MKKITPLLILALFAAQLYGAPYSDPNKTKMIITVTNSNIGEIVREIGGTKVDVAIMAPPVSCPGVSDISPDMIVRVGKSNLILNNKWEKWISRVKLEAGDLGKVYKTLETEGNWMIPNVHIRAAEEIMNVLSGLDMENAAYYQERYNDYAYRVDFAAQSVSKGLAEASRGVKVISNDKIKDFLEAYGFEVIATYGSSEDLTARRLAYLIEQGKKNKVKLVVDNLQMGAGTGNELAENIGAKQAVISNFILGKSYPNTLKDNASRLLKAMQ